MKNSISEGLILTLVIALGFSLGRLVLISLGVWT